MDDKFYKREANPTYFTAKGTLYTLANAKNPDAMEYIKLIDMSDLVSGFREKGDLFKNFPMEIEKRIILGLECAVELRYNVVSNILLKSKYKNFFDIACGYTPRGLFCKKNNIDYVGVDVPIVVDEMNEKVGEMVKQKNHMPYIAADATNKNTLLKAAECFEGEIFISCEGLMMYLSIDELNEYLDGVKEVLLKHGGAWYTSDFGVDYKRVPFPFVNDKNIEDAILKNTNTAKDTNDIKYFSNNFNTETEKIKFFEDKGFNVNKIYINDINLNLNQLENESDEVKKRVNELFATFSCWELTIKDDVKDSITISDNKETGVKIKHSLENEILSLVLEGRIDSLSAPELLKVFDEELENGSIKSIKMDVKGLEYISSAGLRVILKMSKALNGGIVEINGANQVIKEILSTTGFDNFVKIV